MGQVHAETTLSSCEHKGSRLWRRIAASLLRVLLRAALRMPLPLRIDIEVRPLSELDALIDEAKDSKTLIALLKLKLRLAAG